MKCAQYKLGVFCRDKKEMEIKYSLQDKHVLQLIPWLRSENSKGKDIFIGQSNNVDRALILIDDLSSHNLGLMRQRGVNPACVLETSPNNFQAWVSLGTEPMPKEQRKIVAACLAKEFGGDPASTDANHFGRLAGFTNNKPKYLTNDGYPVVLCHCASGQHAQKSEEIRKWAIIRSANETRMKELKKPSINPSPNEKRGSLDPDLAYARYFSQWLKTVKFQKKSEDYSRGDFAVTCRMLKEGYSKKEIIESIINCSPDLKRRKPNHCLDYASRTVEAALKYL
jgi:hypothetical protein